MRISSLLSTEQLSNRLSEKSSSKIREFCLRIASKNATHSLFALRSLLSRFKKKKKTLAFSFLASIGGDGGSGDGESGGGEGSEGPDSPLRVPGAEIGWIDPCRAVR